MVFIGIWQSLGIYQPSKGRARGLSVWNDDAIHVAQKKIITSFASPNDKKTIKYENLIGAGIASLCSMIQHFVEHPFYLLSLRQQVSPYKTIRGPWNARIELMYLRRQIGTIGLWSGMTARTIYEVAYFAPQFMMDTLLLTDLSSIRESTVTERIRKLVLQLSVRMFSFVYTLPLYRAYVMQTLNLPGIWLRPSFSSNISSIVDSFKWLINSDSRNQTLSFRSIFFPAIGYHLIKETIQVAIYRRIIYWLTCKLQGGRQTLLYTSFPRLISHFIAGVTSTIATYPLSTIFHTLLVETIVPKTTSESTTFSVLVRKIWNEYGWVGFYGGFGAHVAKWMISSLLLHGFEQIYNLAIEHTESFRVARKNNRGMKDVE